MFWDDPYKQQIAKKVQSLIAAKKYQEANNICNEVLDKDPDDTEFLKLLKSVEDAVIKENESKIDEKIKSLKPLIKKKEYARVIQELNDLKRYSPQYPSLLEAIAEVQALYRKEVEAGESSQIEQTKEEFENLFKEGKLDKVIQKCQALQHSPFKNDELVKYLDEVKEKVVDVQLENKKNFIAGNKYDEILSFLEGLSNILPKSEKLLKLREETKLRKVHNLSAEQEETSFQAIENIKTLLKLQKYEEAHKAAQELAVYSPESKVVQNLLKEAESKFESQLSEETAKQMDESRSQLKEDYKHNKEDFTSL